MDKPHEDTVSLTAITHDDLLTLDDIRAKCVESSALISAAAELASPIATTPAIERVQSLMQVAERSVEAALTTVEALVARIDARRTLPA